jgi:hypothetical protein
MSEPAPRGAVEAFFAAMRTYPEPISTGWDQDEEYGWIDDRVGRVVAALLAAGWSPPPSGRAEEAGR